MKRAIRIDTLQWFIGIYIAIRGMLMFMLPHKLSTHVFLPIQPYFPVLGAFQMLAGAALIAAVTLIKRREMTIAAHLVAGAALLQAGIGHLLAGSWTGAIGFIVLGVGTAIAPLLPNVKGRHPKAIDLFAVLMGIRMTLEGIAILAPFNAQFNAPLYDPIRAVSIPYGIAYVGSGLALLSVYWHRQPQRHLFNLAHLLGGGLLWAWTAGLGFPTWNSILYFGGLGTLLALLPWIRKPLSRVDPASLRTQLAVALVGIVTLPLLTLVTLVSLPQQQRTIEQALLVQQSLATAISHDVASYVGLHRAATIAIANQSGLASMNPAQQRSLLQSFTQAYPDIVVFTTFDAAGNAIARSDNLPLSPPIASFESFQTARRTGKAVLDIRIGRVIQQPLIVAIVPFRNADGEFAGVVAAAIESARMAEQLAQVGEDLNIQAYLVDRFGRIVAHPNSELTQSFANYSHVPPVAALLGSQISSGKLHYLEGSSWQLVGFSRVPELGWGVIVERSASEVLATLNARRNRDFAMLLWVAAAALASGGFLAGRLTKPLTTLAYAAKALGTGNPQAPLPKSNITEVANLSETFGTMRDRLAQRTEQRDRAEAELRQSEAKFRRLVESNIIGALVAELNGVAIEANDAFLEMMGYSREDLRSGRIRWQETIEPEYVEVSQNAWEELQTTGVCTPLEIEFLRADRTRVPVLIGAARLEETRDRIIGFVLDLSDRKQMERELERLLERERKAREEAESANRIKDEFLAVLSHELRSPLNPILGWAKLLRARKFDEKTMDKALETIERNAKLQTQLIEDLLDVSRILRGKLVLNVAPVNLKNAIEGALETVRLSAEAKAIAIHTRLDGNVGVVSGDSTRLQQVVWNLLSNAVKFTPANGRIEVMLDRVDSRAQIQITDTGKGIAGEFIPHVFEYFRQEDGSTTRQFGGLGLGLAIVRYLVEQHGGTVAADSPGEGLGATFIVRLPLMPQFDAGETEAKLSESGAIDLRGVRVLLVDDEPDMRELAAFILAEAGAQVNACSSASAAIAALNREVPDILLCDIGMPDMDGYSLMRYVRKLPPERGGQIPAIALTAYAAEADRERSAIAGFQMHVAKPVEPDVLVAAIVRVMRGEGSEVRSRHQPPSAAIGEGQMTNDK